MATPRLIQPQQIVEMFCGIPDLYCHITRPVLASSAEMSLLPVGTYMIPS